jgi:hypothetical protein
MNVLVGFVGKDFFEGDVCFRVYEFHGWALRWLCCFKILPHALHKKTAHLNKTRRFFLQHQATIKTSVAYAQSMD